MVEKRLGLVPARRGSWVQTERRAHEEWARLAVREPRAAAVMHVIVAEMTEGTNSLVASQAVLARLAECSVRTLQRALDVLRSNDWIEVVQIGPSGSVCAYVVSRHVAWAGRRDGRRYAQFQATVLASGEEQPHGAIIEHGPLRHLPAMLPDERQLPAGDGLDPPSEPSLPGFEPDLPATKK